MFGFARWLMVVVVAAGAGVGAWGQDRNMTLDVVVPAGKSGAVSGLPAGAFTVLDNGEARTVDSFREVTGPEAAVQVVLVVDAVNARYSTVAYARNQLKKYLLANGGKLGQPTRLAVVMDKGVQLQDHASRDGAQLDAALEKDVIGLREIGRAAGVFGAEERLDDSLSSFGVLMAKLKTEPGRKLVIYISPGWPLLSGPGEDLSAKERGSIFASIVATSAAMREAHVTLYDVNPLGAGESLVRADYYQQFLKGEPDARRVDIGNLGLQVLAVHSGGVVDEVTNGISEAIKRFAKDADEYYELTFRPVGSDGGADYHALQVKVAGNLDGRTRDSYYAVGAVR